MFCKYKNILGFPKEGFHASRFLGFAFNDLIGTLIIAIIFAYQFKISYVVSVMMFLTIAVIMHRLFCVNTALNTIIFGQV